MTKPTIITDNDSGIVTVAPGEGLRKAAAAAIEHGPVRTVSTPHGVGLQMSIEVARLAKLIPGKPTRSTNSKGKNNA